MLDFMRGYTAYLEIFVENHSYVQILWLLLSLLCLHYVVSTLNDVTREIRFENEKAQHERLKQEIIAELKGGDSSD